MALSNTLCARSLRSLALATALLGAVGAACARGYTDHQDGTVTDSATGLQWMRCAQGQTWTGSTCSAGPARYTWAQATALSGSVSFAGHNDWRLPNIRELLSLVDRAAGNPAIDPVAFVDAPSGSFWSASARADTADSAWTVYFAYGNAFGETLDSGLGVRLVRGSPQALMDPARPDADYSADSDGTVTHGPSGLNWPRCLQGQAWSGTACTGDASLLSWDEAQALLADNPGWRLPTVDELLSLVDFGRKSPALNATVFAGAPGQPAWTADGSGASKAWWVHFEQGEVAAVSRDSGATVRLVRSATTVSTLAADAERVFNWAERQYPQFFAPAGTTLDSAVPGYLLRAYAATGSYIGINTSGTPRLYYLGPASAQTLLDLGPLADWLAQVTP